MLSSFYIDNAFYQENILPLQNKIDGHEVMIIASTLGFINGNTTGFTKPATYYTNEGIKVVRVPYIKIISLKISEKIRAYKNVYPLIEDFGPDIIFSHGIGGYVAKTIARYIRSNPHAKLYIDCHSDYINSASNLFSKYILHKLFYRHYFWKYVQYAEKVYYVAPESILFLKELYGFEDIEKLQYFPLGGYLLNDSEREIKRENVRKQLEIANDDVIIIHSGKMDFKKKSYELIKAFTQVKSTKIWLLIIGIFTDDVYLTVKDFIESDERIIYLGWKSGNEIQDYLCGGDIYLQPGGRTVTVQNAVCCGCAIIVNPNLCYTQLFGNAALYAETSKEIKEILEKIVVEPHMIRQYRESLMKIAREKLDYRVLSKSYIA